MEQLKGILDLHFEYTAEFLPRTERTEALLAKKRLEEKLKQDEEKKKKNEQQELEIKKRMEDAVKLKLEKEMKRKQLEEQKKKEEEERQRSQLHGSLGKIIEDLEHNTTTQDITLSGFDLSMVKLRILMSDGCLGKNSSCLSIDLTRKSITDPDGICIGQMLKKNKVMCKLVLDGNFLADSSIQAIFTALLTNASLKHLSLTGNAKALSEETIDAICECLKKNRTLQVLCLEGNGMTAAQALRVLECLKGNKGVVQMMVDDDLLGYEGERELRAVLEGNRETLSLIRRRERKERRCMEKEDGFSRAVWEGLEARRREIEDVEKRRLGRLQERLGRWSMEYQKAKALEELEKDNLMQAADDRKEMKKKGKKKKAK